MPIVPFKLNQDRRHHIPRQARQVTNWPAYDASLRQRGSLTVWFTDEAVEAWAAEPRTTRGGQAWYSALAILTALTLRAVFRKGRAADQAVGPKLLVELFQSLRQVHGVALERIALATGAAHGAGCDQNGRDTDPQAKPMTVKIAL